MNQKNTRHINSFKANKVKIKTEPEDGKKCATLYNGIYANKAISSNFLFT